MQTRAAETGRAAPFPTDEILVAAARRGESAASKQIWKRYAPLVASILRRSFGPWPDGPDLEQEVFLVVFQQLEQLREPDALRGFIAAICVRVARNQVRRKQVRSLVALEADLDWCPSPTAADQEARDVVRRLSRLLDTLNAQDRSLFVSRYIERMEMDEIASRHEMSFSSTRRRVGRVAKLVSARAKRDAVLAAYFESFSFRQGGDA